MDGAGQLESDGELLAFSLHSVASLPVSKSALENDIVPAIVPCEFGQHVLLLIVIFLYRELSASVNKYSSMLELTKLI